MNDSMMMKWINEYEMMIINKWWWINKWIINNDDE